MANNMFLLMAGLGALLFLGRGGAPKTTDEDNRLAMGQGRGGPMPKAAPAFDLQSYVDGLFRDTATVPKQPPMMLFYPQNQVVTSSGVPGISMVAPELITPTTKVAIGGEGGETITASAQAVRESEQLAKQEFDAAANVQQRTSAPGEQYFYAATVEANRIEEERQRKFARDLIAKNIADQIARNLAVVARTRLQQENLARGLNFDGSVRDPRPGMSVVVAGQPIVVTGANTFASEDDPEPIYSESFVISGGMDSPGFASEDEQPYQPTTVHELTAAYDIGF